MTVFELLQACQYHLWLSIWRTNDFGEEHLIARGTKQDIIEDMDEEVFAALSYNVFVIEHNARGLTVKCEDKYFFQSDSEVE